jgi:IS5 family transposase
MLWAQIEAILAPAFSHKNRQGQAAIGSALFGKSLRIADAGISTARRPRLPMRLMTALLYLEHAFNLNDEKLVAPWSGTFFWQYFGGQDYFNTPGPSFNATQIGCFRNAIGEAGVKALLKATIDTAVQIKAMLLFR